MCLSLTMWFKTMIKETFYVICNASDHWIVRHLQLANNVLYIRFRGFWMTEIGLNEFLPGSCGVPERDFCTVALKFEEMPCFYDNDQTISQITSIQLQYYSRVWVVYLTVNLFCFLVLFIEKKMAFRAAKRRQKFQSKLNQDTLFARKTFKSF